MQLQAEDAGLRVEAVRALRAIGPDATGVVEGLAAALEDDSYRMRGDAPSALVAAVAKAAPATDALAKALKDVDAGVRTCAAVALGKIGEPAFVKSMSDEDVTAALNEVYSHQSSKPDPVLSAMQFATLQREDW